MESSFLSGVLQLEILDYLYEKHTKKIPKDEFITKFGSLDTPGLIVNVRQLIMEKLIYPESIGCVGGHESIILTDLRLTVSGVHFIAHNPPIQKC